MSESITEEKSKGKSQTGKVTYSVAKMNNCSHPECESRRNYGVKVTKTEPKLLMNFIQVGEDKQSKVFCPKHRDSVPESRKAIRKEHKVARRRWRRKKMSRQEDEFDKIVESGILPAFRYRNGKVYKRDGRFEASEFEDFEQAINYIHSFNFEIPILLYKSDEYAVALLSEDDNERFKVSDDNISYEEFRERFSDIEFAARQFYPIKTNSLTGMDANHPVNKIEEHIEEVLEWKEYDERQGYIDPGECNLCDSSWGHKHYSRAMIDGEEVIVVSHSRCESIIGELNKRMIDEESYDINLGNPY